MTYFFAGLWHLAAAMAFAVGFGALRGDLYAPLHQAAFVASCVMGSSALFFIPDAMAKKGVMKFLHYPLPDWDVLLLGPASHRHWITHSPILPMLLFWLGARFHLANHALAANAVGGLSVGLSSHLFWDCVSSRTHKIVFIPYWLALRPAWSRVYLLGGAMLSLLVAFSFGSTGLPKTPALSLPSISSTRKQAQTPKSRLQLVAATAPSPTKIGLTKIAAFDSPQPIKVADVRTPEGLSMSPDGTLFGVENVEHGHVFRLRNGQVEPWISTSMNANGREREGRPNGSKFWGKTLYVADSGLKQIWEIAPDKSVKVIVDAARGECVNGPNDLSFAPDGSFYFSDPVWEGAGSVYHCRRDKNGRWKTEFFAGEFMFPNGVAVAPDGKSVFIAENKRNRIWKVALKRDGSAGNKRLWCTLPPVPQPWNGPDGMRFDHRGRLFVAQYGNHAIQVVSPQGRVLDTLNAGGQNPTNVAFSRDEKTLYISETQTNAIYKIDLTKTKLR